MKGSGNTVRTLLLAGVAAAAVIVLAVLLIKGGRSEKTVGHDIAPTDITDFYYTLDSSVDPPVYQRYRFYTENGSYYFYHETREGDHWPLTEEDITVAGTVTLSDAEWTALWHCLEDGTVRPPEANTETGNAGPWLFLYWNGDRDRFRQYTFATAAQQADFEALCEALAAAR